MPIPVDPITRKKLILVKQLYQQAVVQSTSQHSVVSRIMSVIVFDLTIETVLKAVVGSLDTSKVPAGKFQGLIQQSDILLAKADCSPVPDKANIQHVHSIRNDAQHKARYPNESDVSDCRTYTRDFLQKIITDVWGLAFDKISLTDIIRHDKVREFLIDAEAALSQGDYPQAVQHAAYGLTWALNCVKTAVLGSTPVEARGIIAIDRDGKRIGRWGEIGLYDAFRRTQEILLHVALGMNYAHYVRYKRIAGDVFFTKTLVYTQGRKESIDANDAEFVVAYCIDTVVQIESRVGSLDAPLASEHW